MKSSMLWRMLQLVAVTFGLALVVAAVLWARCGLRGCPDIAHLSEDNLNGATVIKDRSGNELARIPPLQHIKISIDSMPGYVPAAFVAMEDQRFWKHHGVDWLRVAGAAYHNIRELSIEQGSSTITMQLARNVFPDRLPASQRTLQRKFEEARVAQMIEQRYSKRRILEMYLNEIYFGRGAYGVEAASREYFGKHAAQLTLAEAALLAGLPRAPSALNPRSNLEQATKGRRTVLNRMTAQHRITSSEAAAAAEAPVRLRRRVSIPDSKAPYFIQAVRQILEDSLSEAVDRFSYTVETTLDSKLQQIAEEELDRQLAAVESGAFGSSVHPAYAGTTRDSLVSVNGTDYLQAALVFMDPRTGDVRALIGGRDYHDSQFNRAFNANRQMASTFKPFVFAAAVAAGYPPSLRLSDQPLRMAVGGKVWSPENDDGKYHDIVTMRQALAASSNVATVRLANMVGLARVIQQAKLAGMSGPFPSTPSVVLGAVEATPLELTTAYATFATLGKQPQPRLVTRVLDANDKVVWRQQPVTKAALDPAVAFVVNDMLKDAIDSGTAMPLRDAGYRGVVAGKTGTSNGSTDFWFVGYTPKIVGTIWIGFDQPKTIIRNGESGAIAAPIWGRIMTRFGDPGPDWKVPPGVIVRRVDGSGRAFAEHCPNAPARAEYVLARTAAAPGCP
jgi:penicillin-binding protein 1A